MREKKISKKNQKEIKNQIKKLVSRVGDEGEYYYERDLGLCCKQLQIIKNDSNLQKYLVKYLVKK